MSDLLSTSCAPNNVTIIETVNKNPIFLENLDGFRHSPLATDFV